LRERDKHGKIKQSAQNCSQETQRMYFADFKNFDIVVFLSKILIATMSGWVEVAN
jgi:hypothetical protein